MDKKIISCPGQKEDRLLFTSLVSGNNVEPKLCSGSKMIHLVRAPLGLLHCLNLLHKTRQTEEKVRAHTCNAAEESEAGSTVSLVAIGRPLPWKGGYRNRHSDWFVELPSSWLHCNNWTERCPVPDHLLHSFLRYWLGLCDKKQLCIRTYAFWTNMHGLLQVSLRIWLKHFSKKNRFFLLILSVRKLFFVLAGVVQR